MRHKPAVTQQYLGAENLSQTYADQMARTASSLLLTDEFNKEQDEIAAQPVPPNKQLESYLIPEDQKDSSLEATKYLRENDTESDVDAESKVNTSIALKNAHSFGEGAACVNNITSSGPSACTHMVSPTARKAAVLTSIPKSAASSPEKPLRHPPTKKKGFRITPKVKPFIRYTRARKARIGSRTLKKHRTRPDIYRLGTVIEWAWFVRVVRSLTKHIITESRRDSNQQFPDDFHWSKEALDALHVVAEEHVVSNLWAGILMAQHAYRDILLPDDMRAAWRLAYMVVGGGTTLSNSETVGSDAAEDGSSLDLE